MVAIPQNHVHDVNYALKNRDYTLIIDKSGSMDKRDMPNGQSRWEVAKESVYAIAAKVFQFDPEGIDLWLFSTKNKYYQNVRPEIVEQIFTENEPFGGTRMGEVLHNALNAYFTKRDKGQAKVNGEIILVMTDGRPDSEAEVVKVLVNGSKRLLPSDKLAINFIQIGHDPEATEFLKFLDNELTRQAGAACDFVETVKLGEIEESGLKQVLLDTICKTDPVHRTTR